MHARVWDCQRVTMRTEWIAAVSGLLVPLHPMLQCALSHVPLHGSVDAEPPDVLGIAAPLRALQSLKKFHFVQNQTDEICKIQYFTEHFSSTIV
jgi:hypothetical protein